MRVLFVPQRSDAKLEYDFKGDVVTATLDGQTDIFDFSSLPDGEAASISTDLPVNPVLTARRVNGVLELELLRYHGPDAPEEVRFPKWQEV